MQSFAGNAFSLALHATGWISSTLGLIVAKGVMVFVGTCFAAEPTHYREGIVTLVPPQQREKATSVLNAFGATLGAWLVASICLSLLQKPYSIALGVFSGVLAFVPNIGALVAGIPAVVLALAVGPERAGRVIAMYWIAHALDDLLVIPIVERRIVHLPPALTILMQIALGGAVGVLGVAFAAPLTAEALVATRILWIEPRSGGHAPARETDGKKSLHNIGASPCKDDFAMPFV